MQHIVYVANGEGTGTSYQQTVVGAYFKVGKPKLDERKTPMMAADL